MDVRWWSRSPNNVTVDEEGFVSAIKPGSAFIHAEIPGEYATKGSDGLVDGICHVDVQYSNDRNVVLNEPEEEPQETAIETEELDEETDIETLEPDLEYKETDEEIAQPDTDEETADEQDEGDDPSPLFSEPSNEIDKPNNEPETPSPQVWFTPL